MSYGNVFLFGAGASHGCLGCNIQPPLGARLYILLKKTFPLSWGSLPEQLESMFSNNDNFEIGMSKLWQDNSVEMLFRKSRLLIDMSILFSSFDIVDQSANVYFRLVLTFPPKTGPLAIRK